MDSSNTVIKIIRLKPNYSSRSIAAANLFSKTSHYVITEYYTTEYRRAARISVRGGGHNQWVGLVGCPGAEPPVA